MNKVSQPQVVITVKMVSTVYQDPPDLLAPMVLALPFLHLLAAGLLPKKGAVGAVKKLLLTYPQPMTPQILLL